MSVLEEIVLGEKGVQVGEHRGATMDMERYML